MKNRNGTIKILAILLLIAGLGYCAYSGIATTALDSSIPDATADG